MAGMASERLRPCRLFSILYCLFGKPAGLRSPELFERTSDTVASFTLRSEANGLLPPPEPLAVFRRSDRRDGVGDGCGDRNGVDDDSSSSMSTALPSRMMSRSSGDGSPRLVRMFMARLRGETGGEGPLKWAMAKEGVTRRDARGPLAINTGCTGSLGRVNLLCHGQVVTPAKSYCLFEYIKDSERVAVAA